MQQIANLLLLRGNFGRPGAGICPVRGHSNVQGDRTVGIDEKPSADLLDQIEKVFGFRPPQQRGRAVVDTVQAMLDGRSKVFIGLGGNFVAAVPDTKIVRAAMRRLKLTVGINTKLNRGHLVHGREALILPCLARSDIDIQATGRQSVTVEDSMSMVHASSGLVRPPSPHLKSEVSIVCGMANATLPGSGIDLGRLRGRLQPDPRQRSRLCFRNCLPTSTCAFASPAAFTSINGPRNAGMEYGDRSRKLPCLRRASRKTPRFNDPMALQLTTIRSHDQYNTTIYSLDDRYRGVFGGRMVVFMNKDDMADRQIEPDAFVELESVTDGGDVRRTAGGFKARPYDVPRGSIAAYYPETNGLLPLSYHDKKSKTPSAKSIPVVVRAKLTARHS